MSDAPVRLLLVDPDQGLAVAWRAAFAWTGDRVSFHAGGFRDVFSSFDAFLSPGNSYGQMDGGVDGVVSRHFASVQRALWAMIADHHRGFLPTGSADVVATGDDRCRWLVYAPTMRLRRSGCAAKVGSRTL